MSVKEGLESEEPDVIKKARGAARGTVTNYINRLPMVLTKDHTGKLLHEKIDKSEVLALSDKIEKSHQIFQDLNERYSQYRERGDTADKEKGLQEADDSYGLELMQKFYSAIADFKVYKKEVCVFETEDVKVTIKISLDAAIYVAGEVAASENPETLKTAQSVKDSLQVTYDSFVNKMADLRIAMKARGDMEDAIGTACEYSAESKAVRKLTTQLESLVVSLQPVEQVEPKVAISGSSSASARSGNTPSIVKLQKMSCPQFSGFARDFAQFKREFSAVVLVPGRSDVDIGYNLLNAIPSKYQHLINNVDLSNHAEMMQILCDKFGTSWLVIDDVVSQIEKLRPVSTDKGFVDFVEKLEKIHRDLAALNITEEIANSTVLGKLEAKLPTMISIDWSKEVTNEKLNRKTSKEKFMAFMTFLKESKDRIEYLTSDARQSSGGATRSVTQVNFVTGVTLVGRSSVKEPQHGSRKERSTGKPYWKPCLACYVDGATDLTVVQHPMETCEVWGSLSQRDKERKVQCLKHPFQSDHTTQTCTVHGL